ncbi:T9SS type A sorting domain-containing protein [Flavobacterium silvaticum]|uniref:T9SS type A sorting domain-containing protein n=1 Tax=Flavobacterium silvaticum TaxID=1852020 RepID=A0A972FMF6_9FLAO|nr:T9SS type A sorting domain-containing protein [Flavobacterium silvaticum]NMH27910.1 T9SS type A sorting domain-containing protein [Flavobacterium silvaticum]
MKKLYISIIILLTLNSRSQTVSTFLESNENVLNALNIEDNDLYAAGSGLIVKKNISSAGSSFTSSYIGGSGYSGICTIGDDTYISKNSNGDPGIYKWNQSNSQFQLVLSSSTVGGLAHRGEELYTRDVDQIFKVDFSTTPATLVEIANNLTGTTFFSRLGLKIYGDYLYVKELSGISRIDLNSPDYQKEFVVPCTGNSFVKAADSVFYVTQGNGVNIVDSGSGTSSLLVNLPGFIGTNDIVLKDNSLFVTAIEGNYDQVARIDLEDLSVMDTETGKFVVYPNPSRDVLRIKSRQNPESVSIITQNGQLVKTLPLQSDQIDISGLSKGIYFIKCGDSYSRFVKE